MDLVEFEGGPIVLKDLSSRAWPVRELLGPWQLDREARAYRRLEGLEGVPRFLGRVDRQAIAIEYVAGRDLSHLRPGDLPALFFDRLEGIVEAVHARGVAHGDLHGQDVLVGPGGEPYVIDFSTAILAAARPGRVRARLFDQARRADRRSVAKLRRRFLGGGAAVPERPPLYRIGRALRRIVDLLRRSRGGR